MPACIKRREKRKSVEQRWRLWGRQTRRRKQQRNHFFCPLSEYTGEWGICDAFPVLESKTEKPKCAACGGVYTDIHSQCQYLFNCFNWKEIKKNSREWQKPTMKWDGKILWIWVEHSVKTKLLRKVDVSDKAIPKEMSSEISDLPYQTCTQLDSPLTSSLWWREEGLCHHGRFSTSQASHIEFPEAFLWESTMVMMNWLSISSRQTQAAMLPTFITQWALAWSWIRLPLPGDQTRTNYAQRVWPVSPNRFIFFEEEKSCTVAQLTKLLLPFPSSTRLRV